MGFLARWTVTLAWIAADLGVGVCTGLFTAFAWDTREDPPYIAFFSSPWCGCAGTGTVVAFALGLMRLHPALQAAASAVLATVGWLILPIVVFAGMVAGEIFDG